VLTVATPQDIKDHVGEETGVSDWVTVDQEMINKFADATGDYQWIHVDVERAKKELPMGTTIAHGYLTLSLLPRLTGQLMKVENYSRGVNYGSNKVRFTGIVPAGSRIRARGKVKSADDVKGNGVRIINLITMEMEGAERPVMVAETISILYA